MTLYYLEQPMLCGSRLRAYSLAGGPAGLVRWILLGPATPSQGYAWTDRAKVEAARLRLLAQRAGTSDASLPHPIVVEG